MLLVPTILRRDFKTLGHLDNGDDTSDDVDVRDVDRTLELPGLVYVSPVAFRVFPYALEHGTP